MPGILDLILGVAPRVAGSYYRAQGNVQKRREEQDERKRQRELEEAKRQQQEALQELLAENRRLQNEKLRKDISAVPEVKVQEAPQITAGGRKFADTPEGRTEAIEWTRRVGEAGRRPPQPPKAAPMEPVGEPQARKLTAQQQTDVSENSAMIADIDETLSVLKARPKGVGLIAAVTPEKIHQRFDPEGVPLRAGVARIASSIRKLMAGTALSETEAKFIKPFIPSEGDSPEALRHKLVELKKWIQRRNDAIKGPKYEENPY